MGDSPGLSAIICTRNRPGFLPSAVETVLANDHPSFELLVIDQSDDASSEEALAPFRKDGRLNYVHTPRPGTSAAANLGVRRSAGALLCFTDDDCRVPEDWLSSIEGAFRAEPGLDLLCGQMLLPPELEGRKDLAIPTFEIPEAVRVTEKGPLFSSVGANFAITRSLYERLAGFDECLGPGGVYECSQDFDLTYRALLAGARILLSPDSWVWHYGARDEGEWRARLRAYGVGDGAFYGKHIRCRDARMLRVFLGEGLRLAAREATVPFRRLAGSKLDYMRGCLAGLKRSWRHPIDRERRVYLPEAAA